ncbi:MAG: acetyltransferase, partial [Sinobacteraceae bacterium]|nr:acetyltransferase [Nevskiaceae bacterium]
MRTLSACLRGTVATALLLANILVWMLPVYALILVKLCTAGTARSRVSQWIANCAQQWGAICVWIWKRVSGVHWVVQGVERLNRDGQYLVIANHQSYNDIPSLMCAFDRRAPFFRFFLKQELIWIPVLGPVWWALDYPFMKRHSAAQIARRPELRGSDLETTRRACARYRHQPVTLLNFVEG